MYSWLRHVDAIAWKRRPIQCTFFLTRRCNARCAFCFYVNAAGPPRTDELSLAEISAISRSLGSLLWLAFSGGEIFLRKDLVDISRVCHQQNRPVFMLYPTNGLMPELIHDTVRQILQCCPRSRIIVKLSLDGIGEEHDRLRGTPGGFAKLMRSYQLLAGLLGEFANFELGVNTVFCAANQDRMAHISDFVAGLPEIRTHTISLVRGEAACDQGAVDSEKYRHAVDRLAGALQRRESPIYRFRGARLKAAQDILQRRLIHRTLTEKRRLIPCYAGRLNLVVREDASVYACEMLEQTLGNLRACDYDVHRLLRSAAAAAVLAGIDARRCHCTHECYFITNILFNPRQYPALLREYVRL
ncbi:MAG: radical SAM protein [Proteobacteria bacterium]|nr:radical SAM protein [Pseudomonadota bacterium]